MLVSAERQNKNKPACFGPFKNLRIIMDTSHFQIEKSKDMQQQGNTYSSYKHYTSAAVCFSISTYGGVSHVTLAYEGRISDKQIVLRSGILDKLKEGDVIMADRGFKLHDECSKRKLILIIPPEMSKDKKKLTAREEVRTKAIASLRIYVEHLMSRVKDWKIQDRRIELLLVPLVSDMIFIAAFCHNFSYCYIGKKK